jgi:hypothetical protein
MPKPEHRSLLPGVSRSALRPAAVFESKRVVRRARMRAVLHDTFDVLLLISVDWFFIRWPRAHVPFLDRHASVLVLAAVNGALLTYVLLMRVFPRWRARRVALTWSFTERARFFKSRRR